MEVHGVNPLFIESTASPYYPYDSFPSGHAQGSTTLWGYIAYSMQSKAVWAIAIVLITLISFSRLYAGLHWPTDLVAGILLAIVCILIGVRVEKLVSRFSILFKWVLIITFPILLFFIFPYDSGAKYSGFLLGGGMAYLIESQYVRTEIAQAWWRRGLAYLIMILGLFGLQTGLKTVFPELVLFDTLRYALIGVWGFLLAPWLLVKVKIYSSLGSSTGQDSQSSVRV